MAIPGGRRLAGLASITIDGSSFDLVGDLVWSPSYVKRETLIGQDSVHGFSELPAAGYIAATLRDNGGLTVKDFNGMTVSTVQCQNANGKGVILTAGWVTEAQEVKTMEGSFNVRFESDDVVELPV